MRYPIEILLKRSMFLVAVTATGCTPVIPFHFAETAEVIAKKEISLTVTAGGGGAYDTSNCCGGGGGRVRFGIGHKMEVGVEATILGTGATDQGSILLGGKVSYKYAPLPYLAVLAGVGATGAIGVGKGSSNGDAGLGADVGAVASTPLLAKYLRVFGGARFSFVIPARGDVYGGGGPTESIIVPLGLSIEPNRRWRIFVEGGFVGSWSQVKVADTAPMNAVFTSNLNGGYGALSVAYVWRNP